MRMKNFISLCIVCALSGCKSPVKPCAVVAADKSAPPPTASMADGMEGESEDISQDEAFIHGEVFHTEEMLDSLYVVDPGESQEAPDLATGNAYEAEQKARQIADNSEAAQSGNTVLKVVTEQAEAVENSSAESQGVEPETGAKAMEEAHGYANLFFVLGFIVVTAGAALAYFAGKSMGMTKHLLK